MIFTKGVMMSSPVTSVDMQPTQLHGAKCPSEDTHRFSTSFVGAVCDCATWQIVELVLPLMWAVDVEGTLCDFEKGGVL